MSELIPTRDPEQLSEHDRDELERFKVFMQRRYEGASQEDAYAEAYETPPTEEVTHG